MNNLKSMVELLREYSFYKSRRFFLERRTNNNDEDGSRQFDEELSQLKKKMDMIETSLKLAGEFNERYKIIIEAYFFNNVRIEDLADTIHVSRSNCYELCRKAVEYMSRVVFGDGSGSGDRKKTLRN